MHNIRILVILWQGEDGTPEAPEEDGRRAGQPSQRG